MVMPSLPSLPSLPSFFRPARKASRVAARAAAAVAAARATPPPHGAAVFFRAVDPRRPGTPTFYRSTASTDLAFWSPARRRWVQHSQRRLDRNLLTRRKPTRIDWSPDFAPATLQADRWRPLGTWQLSEALVESNAVFKALRAALPPSLAHIWRGYA